MIGRLTKDPDLRYTQSGIAVARFTLAVNRNYKNQVGEYDADFIPIQVWRGAAELRKVSEQRQIGSSSRQIQTGSHDKDGTKALYNGSGSG